MEEVTQSFRLNGDTEVLELPCDQDDGHYFIDWDLILDVFPGAQYIKNGKIIVRKLGDTGPDGTSRQRIRHHPGVVLDVVLSSSVPRAPFTPPSGHPNPPVGYQPSDSSETSTDGHDVKNLEVDISDNRIRTEPEQKLFASLLHDIQVQAHASQDICGPFIQAIRDGREHVDHSQLSAFLQELAVNQNKNNKLNAIIVELTLENNKMASMHNETLNNFTALQHENMELTKNIAMLQEGSYAMQEKLLEMVYQTQIQVSQLQNRMQALMTQSYELHEYPIPRLFVILPQDPSMWDSVNMISNNFRLYFLCECGKHTESTNSNIPNHIHFAKHDGYEIRRPTKLFQKYGPYILTVLKMLKFGVSAAGVVVPSISSLVHSDDLRKAAGFLKGLSGGVPKAIDQAISHLEDITKDFDGHSNHMENSEALEGADLRKLESFLKHEDGNKVLANLFRTVTDEGHVKWVCDDHYSASYQKSAVKVFHNTVKSLEGTFDENVGHVKIRLQSKEKAEKFYQALETARSVYELDIVLDWKTTKSDFKKLKSALRKSNVGMLEIDLGYQDAPASRFLHGSRRHDPIFDIIQHPSIRSVEIVRAPEDFNKRSTKVSLKNGLSNLKHMGLDLRSDTTVIKTLLLKTTSLSSLALNDPGAFGVFGIFSTMKPLEKLFESAGPREIQLRTRIHLQSSTQAEQVYHALEKANSFQELDINLDWSTTQSDIERLSAFLTRSKVGSLKLRANLKGHKTSVFSNRKRHDSILDIMRHPSTRSITITGTPASLIKKSSVLSGSDGFPSLRHMEIDLTELKKDIPGIKNLISKASDLSSLVFQGDIDDSTLQKLYVAIAQYQTCPITFAKRSLRIPPLTTTLCRPPSAEQCLAHLLSIGVNIEALGVERRTDKKAIVEGNGTGLKEFITHGVHEGQTDQLLQNCFAIRTG